MVVARGLEKGCAPKLMSDELAPKQRVIIRGLTAEHFNGLEGRLLRFDDKLGRWKVRVGAVAGEERLTLALVSVGKKEAMEGRKVLQHLLLPRLDLRP